VVVARKEPIATKPNDSAGDARLNYGRLLVKINRICAWILLIFMIIFIISGYAWWNRIIMPLQNAVYMHTQLDTYLVFFFLMHVLISTKFTLARWRVGHDRLVGVLLACIGVISFWLVLEIR
jgi:hypothetical protein